MQIVLVFVLTLTCKKSSVEIDGDDDDGDDDDGDDGDDNDDDDDDDEGRSTLLSAEEVRFMRRNDSSL